LNPVANVSPFPDEPRRPRRAGGIGFESGLGNQIAECAAEVSGPANISLTWNPGIPRLAFSVDNL
jgi:hypothetical protein